MNQVSTTETGMRLEGFLIDTGSSHAIMSRAFYNTLPYKPPIKQPEAPTFTRGIGGVQPIAGTFEIPFVPGDLKQGEEMITVTLLEECPRGFILGVPQCHQFGLDISFSKECVTWVDRSVSQNPSSYKKSGEKIVCRAVRTTPLVFYQEYIPSEAWVDNNYLELVLDEDIVLHSGEQTRAMVRLPPNLRTEDLKLAKEFLAIGYEELQDRGVAIPKVIYLADDLTQGQAVPINLTYTGVKPLILSKGLPFYLISSGRSSGRYGQ
ncbi:hypothetical protein HDU98_004317 [Podochytrium sp. JEL0797]|nr:hypothetical protein HDU98_004317 [Podochytrium sp. JEL0797]